MGRYDDLQQSVKNLLANLSPISPELSRQLLSNHPGLPEDFLDFLLEIGAGEIGDGMFVLYNGLVHPVDIYGDGASDPLQSVLLLGDDMQGYCVGYTITNWKIWEISPLDWSLTPLADTFEQFIRDLFNRSQVPRD